MNTFVRLHLSSELGEFFSTCAGCFYFPRNKSKAAAWGWEENLTSATEEVKNTTFTVVVVEKLMGSRPCLISFPSSPPWSQCRMLPCTGSGRWHCLRYCDRELKCLCAYQSLSTAGCWNGLHKNLNCMWGSLAPLCRGTHRSAWSLGLLISLHLIIRMFRFLQLCDISVTRLPTSAVIITWAV